MPYRQTSSLKDIDLIRVTLYSKEKLENHSVSSTVLVSIVFFVCCIIDYFISTLIR